MSTGAVTSGTHDDANQLNSYGNINYTYDSNGNMTGYGTSTAQYDAANRWGSTNIGTKTVVYGYDGLGRRVSRTVNTGTPTNYWYDATGMTEETGAKNATYLRDQGGKLLSIFSESSTPKHMDYATDRLGSITATTNEGGGLVDTFRYDPWGARVGVTGSTYNPYMYTGTYLDTETNFFQMGARMNRSTSTN